MVRRRSPPLGPQRGMPWAVLLAFALSWALPERSPAPAHAGPCAAGAPGSVHRLGGLFTLRSTGGLRGGSTVDIDEPSMAVQAGAAAEACGGLGEERADEGVQPVCEDDEYTTWSETLSSEDPEVIAQGMKAWQNIKVPGLELPPSDEESESGSEDVEEELPSHDLLHRMNETTVPGLGVFGRGLRPEDVSDVDRQRAEKMVEVFGKTSLPIELVSLFEQRARWAVADEKVAAHQDASRLLPLVAVVVLRAGAGAETAAGARGQAERRALRAKLAESEEAGGRVREGGRRKSACARPRALPRGHDAPPRVRMRLRRARAGQARPRGPGAGAARPRAAASRQRRATRHAPRHPRAPARAPVRRRGAQGGR